MFKIFFYKKFILRIIMAVINVLVYWIRLFIFFQYGKRIKFKILETFNLEYYFSACVFHFLRCHFHCWFLASKYTTVPVHGLMITIVSRPYARITIRWSHTMMCSAVSVVGPWQGYFFLSNKNFGIAKDNICKTFHSTKFYSNFLK